MTKKQPSKSKFTDVVIIGGGAAGISAALDPAKEGHLAYLIEKTVNVGGHCVTIYNVFPASWTELPPGRLFA